MLFSFRNWSEEDHNRIVAPFGRLVGPTVPLPKTAVGIFRLFFTTSLINLIVDETNNYAATVLGDDCNN